MKICRMIARVTGWIMVFMLFMPNIVVPRSKAVENQEVYLLFGKNPKFINAKAFMGDDPTVHIDYRNNIDGWLCIPALEKSARYINIDIDDRLFYDVRDGENFEVTVEYFDEGNGSFTMLYSSTTEKETNYVEFKGSNTWKKHTFILQDAAFKNTIDGKADIRLAIWSNTMKYSFTDVLFRSVTVRKLDTKSVFTINPSTEKLGNVFFAGEPIQFTYEIVVKNEYASSKYVFAGIPITAKYTAINYDGEETWSETETFIMNNENKVVKSIEIPSLAYNLYKLRIELMNEEYKIYSCREQEFSYVFRNPQAPLNYTTGVTAVTYVNDYQALNEMISKSGFGYVRWNQQFPYTMPHNNRTIIASYHNVLRDMCDNGIKALGFLFSTPSQYPIIEGEHWPQSDASRKKFGEFAEFMASRYKGIVNEFEFWNEWNLEGSQFNRLRLSVKDYFLALKEVYNGVKRGNPAALVAGAATSGDALEWNTELIKLGGGNYMDILTVHPYRWSTDPITGTMYERLKALRDMLDEHGHQDVDIWVSEVGYSNNYNGITDKTQGYYLAQVCTMFQREQIVGVTIIYKFISDGIVRSEREDNFGLIKAAQNPDVPYAGKIALLCMSTYNALLADAVCTDYIEKNEDTRLYRFSRRYDNKDVAVLFSRKDSEFVALDLGCETVNVYDEYGNKSVLSSINGIFHLTVDARPVYLEGNFNKFRLSEPAIKIEQTLFDVIDNDLVALNIQKETNLDLHAKVTLPYKSAMEVVSVDDFTGSQGRIQIRTRREEYGIEKVNLVLSDGQNIYFNDDITFRHKQPVEIFIERNLDMNGNWNISAELTNNSSWQEVEGKLTLGLPEDIFGTIDVAQNVFLKPGEVKTVKLNVPKYNKRESIDIRLNFESDRYGSIHQKVSLVQEGLLYAYSKPVLDGIIHDEEWNDGYSVVLSGDKYVTETLVPNTPYLGSEDLSAKVWTLWDEENLYIAVQVVDDIHDNNHDITETSSNLWRGDSVQVAVIYDPRDQYPKDTFNEYTFALTDKGLKMYQDKTIFEKSKIDGCEYGIVRNEENKTTTYEIKLPWNVVLEDGVKIGASKEIKLSVAVNDSDNYGRKAFAHWGDGIVTSKNSSLFNKVFIRKQTNVKSASQ